MNLYCPLQFSSSIDVVDGPDMEGDEDEPPPEPLPLPLPPESSSSSPPESPPPLEVELTVTERESPVDAEMDVEPPLTPFTVIFL